MGVAPRMTRESPTSDPRTARESPSQSPSQSPSNHPPNHPLTGEREPTEGHLGVDASVAELNGVESSLLMLPTDPPTTDPPTDSSSRLISTEMPREILPEIPRSVRQSVWVCAEHKKPRRLLRLLERINADGGGGGATVASGGGGGATLGSGGGGGGGRARHLDTRLLIFANKIKTVEFVTQFLTRHAVDAASLTSKKSQEKTPLFPIQRTPFLPCVRNVIRLFVFFSA